MRASCCCGSSSKDQEKDWALVVMRQCLAADWTGVGRDVQDDVQLRQHRNDELNTLLLLA